MIDFTVVVGVDEQHLAEWQLTWPTWVRNRPGILDRPLLAVYDAARPEGFWRKALGFLRHTNVTLVPWHQAGVSQREKMLTGLTLGPLGHVKTPWVLKLDTDVVATIRQEWVRDEWFAADRRGREPAFVAPPWGYTKPADAIDRLDRWGDSVASFNKRPRVCVTAAPGSARVRHKRIISWCFFGRTAWLREVSAECRGTLPVPSHDTFLWYCAERRGDFYRRVPMSKVGWAHVTCRGRLRLACQTAMTETVDGSAQRVEPQTPHRKQEPKHALKLLEVLRQSLPTAGPLAGAEIGVSKGKTSACLLRNLPTLHLSMIDPWLTYSTEHPYRTSGDHCASRTLEEASSAFRQADHRTRFAADRRSILPQESLRAASGFADRSLDFAFIDADHTYDAVRNDLRAWWPKVKPGGLLTGHDYGASRDRRGVWGVKRAVDEWARDLRLAVTVCNQTHIWSARKPTSTLAERNRPVFYLLTGAGHGPRLVVSLWSLRKHFDGPVVLYTTLPESHEIGERCAADSRLYVEHRRLPHPRVRRNASYLAKVALPRAVPEHGGLFLDADTLVVGDLTPLFEALGEAPFVATRFAMWTSARGAVRRRLDRWRGLTDRHHDPSLFRHWLDEAIQPHPAVNTGVFAWNRESEILAPWESLTRFGRRQFICDEVALQILLHRFPHHMLDQRFNCSAVYGQSTHDVRVWHFHGDKHLRREKGQRLWLPAFHECLRANSAGIADWAVAREPKLASAVS